MMSWKRLLAYITGSVDQELLLRHEYEETLSRLLLFGERSLWHALKEYETHYHQERPHQRTIAASVRCCSSNKRRNCLLLSARSYSPLCSATRKGYCAKPRHSVRPSSGGYARRWSREAAADIRRSAGARPGLRRATAVGYRQSSQRYVLGLLEIDHWRIEAVGYNPEKSASSFANY